MRREEYADLMSRYFQYVDERKLEPLLDLFADDASMLIPIMSERISGRAGLRAFFAEMFASYSTIRTEILDMIIDEPGARCACEQHVRMLGRDGKAVEFPRNSNHFYFEDGKLKEVRGFKGQL